MSELLPACVCATFVPMPPGGQKRALGSKPGSSGEQQTLTTAGPPLHALSIISVFSILSGFS